MSGHREQFLGGRAHGAKVVRQTNRRTRRANAKKNDAVRLSHAQLEEIADDLHAQLERLKAAALAIRARSQAGAAAYARHCTSWVESDIPSSSFAGHSLLLRGIAQDMLTDIEDRTAAYAALAAEGLQERPSWEDLVLESERQRPSTVDQSNGQTAPGLVSTPLGLTPLPESKATIWSSTNYLRIRASELSAESPIEILESVLVGVRKHFGQTSNIEPDDGRTGFRARCLDRHAAGEHGDCAADRNRPQVQRSTMDSNGATRLCGALPRTRVVRR